jgi:hypothetical protein
VGVVFDNNPRAVGLLNDVAGSIEAHSDGFATVPEVEDFVGHRSRDHSSATVWRRLTLKLRTPRSYSPSSASFSQIIAVRVHFVAPQMMRGLSVLGAGVV